MARLAGAHPLAAALLHAMRAGLAQGHTPGPDDVDAGNLAPVLENHILAFQVDQTASARPPLPCERIPYCRDFPDARLFVRGTQGYYVVAGVQTGGVVRVFERASRRCVHDDGGFVARIGQHDYSTQATGKARVLSCSEQELRLEAPFQRVPRTLPTPGRFLVLRALNLTVMRSIGIGNAVKRGLVRLLIRRGRIAPLTLTRGIRFEANDLVITDLIRGPSRLPLLSLRFGAPFRGVHMASAGYLSAVGDVPRPRCVDLAQFPTRGELQVTTRIECEPQAGALSADSRMEASPA